MRCGTPLSISVGFREDLPTPLSHCNVTVAATGLVVGLDGDRLGWLSVAVSFR
jgi:hypothetical protein